MKTIYLYGDLADKFGDRVELDVNSIAEAIKALRVMFKGFSDYLYEHKFGFHIKVGSIDKGENDLTLPIGKSSDIHIIPAITGSGRGGVLLVLGVALIAASGGFGTPGLTSLAGSGGAFAAGSMAVSMVSQIGVGLALAGISAILFAPPKAVSTNAVENTPNTYFNGAVNTMEQGNPVPIGYGELIVGSAIINAGISIDSSNANNNASWEFSALGQDGWIIETINGNPTGDYININTNIVYETSDGTYRHSTTKNVSPAFFGYTEEIRWDGQIIYYTRTENGDTVVVEPPIPTTVTITYTYNGTTGIYRQIAPTCERYGLWGRDLENKYCSDEGSSIKPSEWGTK